MSTPPAAVVLITTPPTEADRIAEALVEAGLAACVNILPGVRSVYRWEDALHHDEETVLIVKTTAEAVPALTKHVRSIHPYDNPEVVALPAAGGSEMYLAWVADHVTRVE